MGGLVNRESRGYTASMSPLSLLFVCVLSAVAGDLPSAPGSVRAQLARDYAEGASVRERRDRWTEADAREGAQLRALIDRAIAVQEIKVAPPDIAAYLIEAAAVGREFGLGDGRVAATLYADRLRGAVVPAGDQADIERHLAESRVGGGLRLPDSPFGRARTPDGAGAGRAAGDGRSRTREELERSVGANEDMPRVPTGAADGFRDGDRATRRPPVFDGGAGDRAGEEPSRRLRINEGAPPAPTRAAGGAGEESSRRESSVLDGNATRREPAAAPVIEPARALGNLGVKFWGWISGQDTPPPGRSTTGSTSDNNRFERDEAVPVTWGMFNLNIIGRLFGVETPETTHQPARPGAGARSVNPVADENRERRREDSERRREAPEPR